MPDAKGETIVAFAKQSVEPGSLVLSDGLSSYILAKHGYRHRVVAAGSLDRIHMSFGNFKTWILATPHGVSSKHMQASVNEFVFRHNRLAPNGGVSTGCTTAPHQKDKWFVAGASGASYIRV